MSCGKYGTSFQESEALLAITAEDAPHALSVVKTMSDMEVWALKLAADELASMCQVEYLERH